MELLPVIIIDQVDTITKSHDLANAMITALKSGNINPIDFAVKRKFVMDALDEVYKDPEVKQILVNEISGYGKEKPVKHGAEVTVRSIGKYDYSKDPVWASIKFNMAAQEAELKAQEELIKVATKTGSIISDPNTGEVMAVPVPCPQTDSIVVSLKKVK